MTRDGEVNMPACPMVTAKLKAGESAKAIEAEQMRRAHVYKNDVDLSKSYLNEVIWYRVEDNQIRPTFDEAIARRLGELKTRRKIRKDAVKALGILISCNGQLEGPEAVAYLKKCADWLAARYGRENVLQAVVHMDEGTPHLHFWFAPVIHDERTGFDRLAAKSVFSPNVYEKKNGKRVGVKVEGLNSILQREFYEQVASKYGFDKPLTWDERFQDGIEYKTHDEFKAGKRRERFEQEAAAADEQARQAAALEQVARAQADAAMGDYVKTAAAAAKAEEERDALRDEVAALHGERCQAVEATKAARAAQGEAEQAAHSAREAADRAAVEAAESKAAAAAEAERLESVRRAGKASDSRVGELEAAIAAERLRVEVEADLAFCIEESGGGRAAANEIESEIERCREAGERAESRACELERDAAEARMACGELGKRIDELRPARELANREVERRVGARAAEIGSAGEELRGRCAAARARFVELLGQARERIEAGLTAATESLYQSARRALAMVHGYEPDTRLADGLTTAYKAADAAVKPAQMPQAQAYRQQVAHALKAYEKAARAAKGTPWHRFPKPALPAVPALVGSARADALRARSDARGRADALRRQYASGRPSTDPRAAHFEPARREREQSRSRSR